MKIFSLLTLLVLTQCQSKKFRIEGQLEFRKGEDILLVPAIGYTDKIDGISGDTTWFWNSSNQKLIFIRSKIDTLHI